MPTYFPAVEKSDTEALIEICIFLVNFSVLSL